MINILIVDDHQLMIDGIKTTLEDVEGLQVVNHAYNGKEALELLEKTWEIQIVLMDINMPEMDGVACIEEILNYDPAANISIISGYEQEGISGLSKAAQESIKGYRAPSYSIGEKNIWALDVLCEEGHEYSSSIYPIKHDLYGMPNAPRFAHYYCNGKLLEIPISTLEILGKKIPCGGGGFFRLYPYAVSKWAIQHVNKVDNQPTVFYFHPWEIDPQQPRQSSANMKSKFRHYLNLDRMESRIIRLLQDFNWDRIDKVFLETHAYSNILSAAKQ